MADKEVTVYIVDLGRSMGKLHQGRLQGDLDWALRYFWDKISNTVYIGRKTALVGVLGLGTDETDNEMGSEDSYRHISVLQRISQILMPDLQRLPAMLKASDTDDRDTLSAIIIAVDMITKHCKHLQYKKKIVVITNGTGPMDDDDVETTAEEIKNNNIELVVLGIDFDDIDYGFTEDTKSSTKAKNERTLRNLVDTSGGTIGTMQEAIDSLSRPHVKPTRPTPTYKGQLHLGDPQQFDTALTIDVERYFKICTKKAPTASAYAVKVDSQSMDQNNLSSLHNHITYTVKDESSTEGVMHLTREELTKGYEYGRTAVHISETDENITKLETDAAYEILGFIPSENVERYMLIDNSNMLVAQRGNDKAALALSSLIHAIFELGSVALARFVKKDMAEPAITLLSPWVETDFECLIENMLPFAEDIRAYRFPPLDQVLTVSGKRLAQHRNLPNDDLIRSMSDFVDSMSLVGGDEEKMAIEDTFSPVLHTIENAIKYRAVHPKSDIPAKSETFLAYSKPSEELQLHNQDLLKKLIEAADVKKVPPKVKGRRRYRDIEKPLSGLDVAELFRKEKQTRISPDNAIPEFKQILEVTADHGAIKDAVKQLSAIIEDQIRSSFGDSHYARTIEVLGVAREEMVGMEMPALYNDLLRKLKKKILSEELNGNRRELWWRIRSSKIGLIDQTQSEFSDVSLAEAEAFITSKRPT